MRYISNGIQEKEYASYFFDSSIFDIYSYFIFFDSSMQYIELAGLIDETDVDFDYVDWDYWEEYDQDIRSVSDSMFDYLQTFDTIPDYTMSPGQDTTNENLKVLL